MPIIITNHFYSLLHFALFAIACRDMDLLRKRGKYASNSHADEMAFSTNPLPTTLSPSVHSPSNRAEIATPIEPTVFPLGRNETPCKQLPYNQLSSGQNTHPIEHTAQRTYPVELENRNTIWPPEMEDRAYIYPPPTTNHHRDITLGNMSEDNSPVVGHPAMGSVDKEFETRMQMERDAINHPALRQLNAKEKEIKA
ncbi:MAG: hypothetical protein M1812_005752 [Candelaria pacifica]|nr:MAG: hypothetical protein M1812_005752 [Candelaria pacifica]